MSNYWYRFATMLRFASALFPCFSRSKTNDDDEVTSSGNRNVSAENLHCDPPAPVTAIPAVVRQISQEIDIPPASQQNDFWWTDHPSNRASIFFEEAKMAEQARKNRSRRSVPLSRRDTISIKSNETFSSLDSSTGGEGCNCLSEREKRHKIGVVVPCHDSSVPRVFAFEDDEMKNQEIMQNAQSIAAEGTTWKAFIYFNTATKKVELDIEEWANG